MEMTQYQKDSAIMEYDFTKCRPSKENKPQQTISRPCSCCDAICSPEDSKMWAKEHPFVTYEQKYEETFGVKPVTEHGDYYCPCMTGYKCPHIDTNTLKSSVGCEDCKEQFWKSEYKLPKKESEVDDKTD